MRTLAAFTLTVIASSPATAQVVAYTNHAAWLAALGGRAPVVIGFDDAQLNPGEMILLSPQRYQNVPGKPSLLVVSSPTSNLAQPIIYRPGVAALGNGISPRSGQNLLALDPWEASGQSNGRIQIEFDQNVRALGIWFIDVESFAAAASCSVSTNPTIAQLPAAGGNGARQFLDLAAPPGQRLFYVNIDVASSDVTAAVFLDDLELLPTACSIADVATIGGVGFADGHLTPDDLIAFLQAFFTHAALADLVGPGGTLPRGNQYTADDVIAFLAAFFAGCQY